jgi:hypothetical protein
MRSSAKGIFMGFTATILPMCPYISDASLSWVTYPDDLGYSKTVVEPRAKALLLDSVATVAETIAIRRLETNKFGDLLHTDFVAASENGAKILLALVGPEVSLRYSNKLYRVRYGGLIYHLSIAGQPVALAFLGFNTHEIERILIKLNTSSNPNSRYLKKGFATLIEWIFSSRATAEETRSGPRIVSPGAHGESDTDNSTINKLAQSFAGCYIGGGISALNATVVEPVRFVKDQILEAPSRAIDVYENLSYARRNPRQYWENTIEHSKVLWAQAKDLKFILERDWNNYWRKPVGERNRILCGLLTPAMAASYLKLARAGGVIEAGLARRQMERGVSEAMGDGRPPSRPADALVDRLNTNNSAPQPHNVQGQRAEPAKVSSERGDGVSSVTAQSSAEGAAAAREAAAMEEAAAYALKEDMKDDLKWLQTDYIVAPKEANAANNAILDRLNSTCLSEKRM